MTVETVEGEGFVAVRKADEPRTRGSRRLPLKASDDAAGHPSAMSKTRPRSPRLMKVCPRERVNRHTGSALEIWFRRLTDPKERAD